MESNKKNKIIYVITKSQFGGAQKYVYEKAANLAPTSDVLVVTGKSGLLNEKLNQAGVPNTCISSMSRDINLFYDVATFFSLINIFFKEKPSEIYLNSSKAGGLGALAGRIYKFFSSISPNRQSDDVKIQIIFIAHGLAFNENRGFFQKILIKKIYWLTVLLSDKTIAVSEATALQLKSIPFIQKRKMATEINVINPVHFLDKNTARQFIESKIGRPIKEGERLVGSVAELHPIKGLDYLVQASEKMKETSIIIFGDGEIREQLADEIRNKGLQNRVHLLGYVDNAAQYLKALDIYVCSSLSEGLSLSILEARQANLPIVLTNVGGNSEAISGYDNHILIESKNPEQIATATSALLAELKTKSI